MDLKFLPYKSMTKDSRRDKTAVLYSTTFSLINAPAFLLYKILAKPVEFLSEHTFSNVSTAYQMLYCTKRIIVLCLLCISQIIPTM